MNTEKGKRQKFIEKLMDILKLPRVVLERLKFFSHSKMVFGSTLTDITKVISMEIFGDMVCFFHVLSREKKQTYL